MPSRAVDDLWHEFILDTDEYHAFCSHAYGRFLHHRPERAMSNDEAVQLNGEAMALTFALACRDEAIPPRSPSRLPVLFKVDDELGLDDGQRWVLSCGNEVHRPSDSATCVRHSLLPLVPKELPKQGRLTNRGEYRMITGEIAGTGSVGGGCGGGGHGCGGHGDH